MFIDKGLNIVKMADLPSLIYRFNTILIKTPTSYFAVIDKLVTKVYMEMAKDPEQPTQYQEEKN